jgi:hypothetical protein
MTEQQLEFRRKWVAALRSGDYIQGNGRLKMEEFPGIMQHCCMGVLCEIVGIPSILDKKGTHSFRGQTEYPPQEAVLAVGLKMSIGARKSGHMSLVGMNDAGYSFEEIANVIETDQSLFL